LYLFFISFNFTGKKWRFIFFTWRRDRRGSRLMWMAKNLDELNSLLDLGLS